VLYLPTIYKVSEFDLLNLTPTLGCYYFCIDTRKLYIDTESEHVYTTCTVVPTESERLYDLRPVQDTKYYIWETNTLWLYSSGWVFIVGSQPQNSGYYIDSGILNGTDETVLDNNGLLKDGSVCIRDPNRIIKGKMYFDLVDGMIVLSSAVGSGFKFFPTGSADDRGNLLISIDNLEGKLVFKGDVYTEHVVDEVSTESKLVSQSDLVGWGYENQTNVVSIKTIDYTITENDNVIVCNKSTEINITLPDCSVSVGKRFIIKNINTGIANILPDGGDTIDGESTVALDEYESITLICISENSWAVI